MYPYTPLQFSDRSIRLLRIQMGNHFSTIRCRLFETVLGLEKGCPYKALSYTWHGLDHIPSQAPFQPCLLINGFEVTVNENLYTALRHIRREDQDLDLWV